MKFLLAKKVNMTQIFGEDNEVQVGTILNATPNVVSLVRTVEKDGYDSVQVAFGSRKEKNVSKPLRGHLKDLGNFGFVREFRGEAQESKRGDSVSVDVFKVGDKVRVSATSKGKGFQGVVKRHGFSGGPRTHGQKHSEREAGSIGGGGRAGGRVVKGMRMAGRMGGERVTVKNLTVLGVDKENNIILVSGAVPGRRGTLVEIRAN
jgi:large subunit ribosomal protein L3